AHFDAEAHRLDVEIDFGPGSRFACPTCGAEDCPAYDTERMTWRHLDFFQHQAYLNARVPRVRCEKCGVKKISVPWARPDSGFTLLFEAMVMAMVPAMPVKAVARIVGEHDTKLWRVIHYYVDQARGRDAATVAAFVQDLTAHRGAPEAIGEVCIDMSPAFIKGVADNLPEAAITFDKFHAVKIINEAVDQVRRAEQKDARRAARHTLHLAAQSRQLVGAAEGHPRQPADQSSEDRARLSNPAGLPRPLRTALHRDGHCVPQEVVLLGHPLPARTNDRGRTHGQAPLGRHPALVRQQDRQRADRGHQQPGPGRQGQSARLPVDAKSQGNGLSARRQARPQTARLAALPTPNSEEPIFFRHRFIERALTAGLREEFCDRPLEVRLDLPNPLGLAVEGRGRVKIGIVIELNERLESNAKPATVIENCMMVVRDPPRPRIEIKAVVEHAVLRGAAEFSVGIATPNRPVSPSGTGIVFQELDLVSDPAEFEGGRHPSESGAQNDDGRA